MTSVLDTMMVTCNECGYGGTLAAVQIHSCDIQNNGGRCEDYPCCGHTDGDGCQTLPSHTADFYYRNPQFMYEPGSPEWFDALDQDHDGPEFPCKTCDGEYDDNTDVFENGDKLDTQCIACRIRAFVMDYERRRRTQTV